MNEKELHRITLLIRNAFMRVEDLKKVGLNEHEACQQLIAERFLGRQSKWPLTRIINTIYPKELNIRN